MTEVDCFHRVQRKDELSINHIYFCSDSMSELAMSVQVLTPNFSRLAKCDWKWFVTLCITLFTASVSRMGSPTSC